MVEKRIAGDWYDIKEASDNPARLDELFALSDAEAEAVVGELRLSVEESVVEYKRRCLTRGFAFVESLKYDSRNLSEIVTHIATLRVMIYVTLLQRQFAVGLLFPRKPRQENRIDESVVGYDVKEILADVRERVAKNAELQKNASVKNILMQVSIQHKELSNMKALAPNIPKEKQAAFYDNFRKSFESITAKIRDNYATLLAETDEPKRPEQPANPLLVYDLKPLGPLYLAQSKQAAQLWSTLSYAEEEGYKTREILSGVPALKESSLASVERELREYEAIAVGKGKEIARAFGWELIRILSRRLPPAEEPEPRI